ncbi:hypothetical protein JB92DRAFT_571546 [Gautieria morchelliformis]|nr:hypothetical protein JB92DRAFT_571546 [Gautieria morchelliformis]
MWCTRWFLPLLLLPLPTASPYFLFLFFFSLTLHARPCFYCIVLLTALFTSSCYWQPVPTRALLQASFTNVTSSPLLYLPNASVSDENTLQASQLLPVPRLATLSDRCWCDLSGGHLFDPYNITLWQLTSLSRTLGATKSQQVLVAQEAELPSKPGLEQPDEASETRRMANVWILRMTTKNESRSDEEGEMRGVSESHHLGALLGSGLGLSRFFHHFRHFQPFLSMADTLRPTTQRTLLMPKTKRLWKKSRLHSYDAHTTCDHMALTLSLTLGGGGATQLITREVTAHNNSKAEKSM